MSVYIAFIRKTAPKVLTQVDRDAHSMTYGSCDRNFWHLKIRDFSSAILQQTGLSLLLLNQLDFKDNIFFKKDTMLDWAEATLYFWKKIQLRDGSFNEYYPNEHGFPPSAFSLYSACEIYKRLHIEDTNLIDVLEKTGHYLVNHIEMDACNQEIASITALYSLYTINRERWVLEGLNKKLDHILTLQSQEGWFAEYGGADIGYLSVSLDMLAEYYWMSRDERVIEPLNRMIDFIKYFVHPDRTIGGEYGSRNTTYFLPNGLEVMAQLGNRDAIAIKDYLLKDAENPDFFMDSVDDRYCSHYLLHSFLRALQKEMECGIKVNEEPQLLPCQHDCVKNFIHSGISVIKKQNVYIVLGLRKGGVVKLYVDGTERFINCGYRVNYGNGKVAAMNWEDSRYQIEYLEEELFSARVSGYFNIVSLKVPTPFLHFGLRIAAKCAGSRIIGTLKSMIILVDKHSDIYFERKIIVKNDRLVIEDEIRSPHMIDLESAANFSLRHVASGKFFSVSDLTRRSHEVYKKVKRLSVREIVDLNTGEILRK